MNSMKLNPTTESHATTGEPVLWGDIGKYIREGERQRAEYFSNAVSSAIGRLKSRLGAKPSEARAQANSEIVAGA